MENQILRSLLTIRTRLSFYRNTLTIDENLNVNAKELEIISNRLNLNKEEALIVAGSFIVTTTKNRGFSFSELSSCLEIEVIELLCHVDLIKNLIEKGFLVEVSKENNKSFRNYAYGIEMLNIEFGISDDLGKKIVN